MAESRLSANDMVARPAKRLRLVVLGGRPDSLPAPNGTALSAEPRGGFDAALVVGPVDAAALWSALEAGRAATAATSAFPA